MYTYHQIYMPSTYTLTLTRIFYCYRYLRVIFINVTMTLAFFSVVAAENRKYNGRVFYDDLKLKHYKHLTFKSNSILLRVKMMILLAFTSCFYFHNLFKLSTQLPSTAPHRAMSFFSFICSI